MICAILYSKDLYKHSSMRNDVPTIVKFKRIKGSNLRCVVKISGAELHFNAKLHIRYVLVGSEEELLDTYVFFYPALETIILHGIYSYAICN